ncbi:P-loop containing nucleoside triphosphate hydrolase protein [Meira miltonrushii]|uniref:P-loop containing nucleoside triphosphate hydrolase protein n=1 Tax=Meira miltonrushii TaxID=1280837 RepID=A0A316V2J5_9BASI|nr:P-loop containing nucleoside triphosphate hydrolase protein [Meira miltonrushii]PWN31740.1 P-loop containing nucleoside triphosphate hydrolase protein [Meira miltonrushii]
MPGSPRLLTRRSFRRTVSTPITTRKRSRSIFDNCDQSENGESADTIVELRLPSSRPRLNASQGSTDEELASVFHSSQATPMSEVFSLMGSETAMSSPISRCTTPEASEAEDEKEQDADSEEETSKYTNIFAHARALLRYGSDPNVHIVGRERERGAIQRFMQQRFGLFAHMERSAMPQGDSLCTDMNGAMDGGSLYVCGLPGTGKTALIRSVMADIQQSQEFLRDNERLQVAFIDCMTIQHPRELFRRILNVFHGDKSVLPSGEAGDAEAERQVTTLVKDQKRQTLIVLDEIDHLLRSRVHQNILYRLFSWPQKDSKACALIGIANSLDLTERFVPLLASKGAAPAVLNFRPFEAEEIKTVIGSRLALLQSSYSAETREQDGELQEQNDDETVPLFVPAAFELVARKIAAATGDLRKALDACRLAVELVEQETIRKSTSTAAPIDITSLTPTNAPKITPAHILKVVSTVLGSPQLNKIRGLGLQPKLILLALLVAQKRRGYGLNVLGGGSGNGVNKSVMGVCSSNGDGTLMCEIESTYSAILKNDDFPILESSELIDVMEGLEVEGIVKITSVNGSSINSSSSNTRVGGVSPSAKRAAKRQLLASYRRMELTMSSEEIIRGIMTPPPASMQSQSNASFSNTIVIEAIKRIWQREEKNAERAKGWEKVAEEAQKVRDNELGGGRGALGI